MGKVHPEIDAGLAGFLRAQPVFFVGSAPLAPDGHVNVSPRGLDSLRVLGPRRVAWIDRVGSGIETIAHLRQNGRVTLLFCAFEGPPRIVRLYGRGRVVEPGDAGWGELAAALPPAPAARAIVVVDLDRIADSCGYGVPRMRYQGDREQLDAWAARKGPAGVAEFRRQHNARSVDGLPGLLPPPDAG